jgi:hypothetical protein
MPTKTITRETLTEALERLDDVLAFHYPNVKEWWPAHAEGAHPWMVSQMADVLIDSLPVIGTPPNGWAL